MAEPLFITWVHKGLRYLAVVPKRGHCSVVDVEGRSYGTYMSVENFRRAQRLGSALAAPITGPQDVELQVVHKPHTSVE